VSEAKPKGQPVPDLPFEAALEKLEAIVDEMENGELTLENLLARYEEGTRLAAVCQNKLAQAEVKLQQLEKHAEGQLELKPFTPPDEPPGL
jgi:exodeoxyribonuclease VII small subunit